MAEHEQPKKLWGGRFTGKTDPLMEEFNESIHFDKIMWEADLRGSQVYAAALKKVGILSEEEEKEISRGLSLVADEWKNGTFEIKPGDEDIHTANERRLSELIGAPAGKLHTGRSRNDQVATDVRLWLRAEVEKLQDYLKQLIEVAVARAEKEVSIIFPGFTHLQRAQPIRWSHWILSYAWCWERDLERLSELTRRMNFCPLGSGALAGNPFGLDRSFIAEQLGFSGPTGNSLDSVSDRDFIVEFLFWASLHMVHLSRWAEDLIIYCTTEFGFVKLADAYSTGSSLMPQKKNPDSLELLRGKAGRAIGQLTGLLSVVKGIPSTYNKDLQEDKEGLFDCVRMSSRCIRIATGVLSTLVVCPQKMRAAVTTDMLATDLADYLVRRGIPFRQTHHIAGAVVKLAEDRGTSLADIPLADLQAIHPAFSEDVQEVWDLEASVERRNAVGGTSTTAIADQAGRIRALLARCQ